MQALTKCCYNKWNRGNGEMLLLLPYVVNNTFTDTELSNVTYPPKNECPLSIQDNRFSKLRSMEAVMEWQVLE